MCKKLLKLKTQHKTIIRFGLIVFLFKSQNVFNLLAATKNWITNYTFFVNSFMVEVPNTQELVHSFAEQINGLFFYDRDQRLETIIF